MKTYNELLHLFNEEIIKADVTRSTLRYFLFELCNEKGIDLYSELDRVASEEIEERFRLGVKRLCQQEPLAYILGYRYFYGYPFIVNKDVLIPRDETAELVAFILSKVDENYPTGKIKVCDIGCGSGAIGITLKKEEPRLEVALSDISSSALAVAKENAKVLQAEVSFYCGDMLEPLLKTGIKYDILVSNPPYIADKEIIEDSVYNYEPHLALFGGDDGLDYYRTILQQASSLLKERGFIFFEIGYNQKEAIIKLAREYYPLAQIEIKKDINGKNRMFCLSF